MNAARHKYSTLIENGEWQAKAETEESHIALQDKFKNLQSELKNLKRERNSIPRKEKAISTRKRPEGWMENDQAQTRGALNYHSQKEIIPLV